MNKRNAFLLLSILVATTIQAELRVMTFNYLMSVSVPDPSKEQQKKNKEYPVRRKLAVKLLKDFKPDIIGFQEPHLGDNEYFKEKLGYNWVGDPIVPFDKQNKLKSIATLGKAGTDYNPIFYNSNKLKLLNHGTFWLNEKMKKGEPSNSWKFQGRKHFHIRACTWAQFEDKQTGQKFWVFNTHLSIEQKVIEKELDLIARQIAKKVGSLPVFFIGDFNRFVRDEPSYGGVSFTNSRIVAETKVNDRANIDNILLKNIPDDAVKKYENVSYIPYTQGSILPSDHKPVYVDVVLPQQAAVRIPFRKVSLTPRTQAQ